MKNNTNSKKTTRNQRNALFWIIVGTVVIVIIAGIIGIGYYMQELNITSIANTDRITLFILDGMNSVIEDALYVAITV